MSSWVADQDTSACGSCSHPRKSCSAGPTLSQYWYSQCWLGFWIGSCCLGATPPRTAATFLDQSNVLWATTVSYSKGSWSCHRVAVPHVNCQPCPDCFEFWSWRSRFVCSVSSGCRLSCVPSPPKAATMYYLLIASTLDSGLCLPSNARLVNYQQFSFSDWLRWVF